MKRRYYPLLGLLLIFALASCRVSVSPSEPGPDLNPPQLERFTVNGASGGDDDTVVLPSTVGQTRADLVATVNDRRSDVTTVVIEVFFIPNPSETTLVESFDATREGSDRYRATWDFSDDDNGFYGFRVRSRDAAGNISESNIDPKTLRVLLFRDAVSAD